MSARIVEEAALSSSLFCKRYRSSYETPSPSSSLTLPIRKRYWGTSDLVEYTKDESLDLDTKGEGSEDEGPCSNEEEAVLEGQKLAVLVVDTMADEPLGLGYEALRRHELTLGEGSMPSTFEIGQNSSSAPAQQRTPASPKWSFDSLPVLPSSPIVPNPVASPVTSPIAMIVVDEDEFLEVGAQLELHGSILHDHTHRLDALPPYCLRVMIGILESCIQGHVDAQRAKIWHARYDDHRLIHDLLVQNTTMQRELQELRDCVITLEREGSRRGQ
nr:hypothetical protein [Tanacetum cinerariifolium]